MPPIFKRFARFLLLILANFALFAALYLGAAWLLGNTTANETRTPSHKQNIAIFIVSNGVHSDIVLPMRHDVFDWHSQVNPQDTAGGTQTQAQYIGIGWGDRGFYLNTPTWADLTASTALKAAFGLNGSALHISYHAQAPTPSEHVVQLHISETEYRQLLNEILPTFQRDEHGKTRLIAHHHYGSNDAFYEANGRYSLLNTCNTWTNARLKNSQLPAVKWTPFAHHIVQHHHNREK
ncbi:TIGR02117 family protein [Alysiella filiformis]|uniref:TIGR02117 family protein n=1 Tax=Alysiella filiformis DSM 16848 TaxID=1120981 RepID=A0A286E2J7_9NEIS|nr:TIGR02117 family protein [Alysiella filiformis]QMT30917.1 TIGR02117 family protein [Alysiella filiformis]UBQ56097.1 TIGR02117 family protein [Alysiella filiformis DSM 16848]SOD65120.1 conserved hypothetical protein [Alysiella filiformis DSM 16848]